MGMSSIVHLLLIAVVLLGVAACVAAVAVRTSQQCRHRVAHARVIAQARRIEEARRQQFLQRLSSGDMSDLARRGPEHRV
jgi:uncharacterized OsmC-like protein